MKFPTPKKVTFFLFSLANYAVILLKFWQEFTFDFFAATAGISWMLWNFYGFLFAREMSMRGRIANAKDSDTGIRRVLALIASIVIYFMVWYLIFKR